MYVLEAKNQKGQFLGFYTGRAGEGFIHREAPEAFTFTLLEGARRKATCMNRMTPVHGVAFVAVRADGADMD